MIDWDCDGYGPGSPKGPDADDNDPNVNTASSALAKYGSTSAVLAHLGYTPQRMLFISTNGNDSSGQPNSETQTYRSWNGISGIVKAGDAVIYRAGTYNDSPYLGVSGASGSPIIVMGYPGEQVILDYPANGAVFVGQSYIVLDGLILQNSTDASGEGIFFGQPANNIVIRNMEVRKHGRGILGMNGLNNILIERSVLHDTTTEHNIYLGSREMPSSNVTVQYNILYNGAYNGFQFNGRVTNLVADSNIIHSNGLSAFSLIQGVSNSTFKNNVMFNNARNCFILFDYVDPNPQIAPYDQTGDTFVNNTCWIGATDRTGAQVYQPAVNIDSEGLNVSLDNHRFENNIFVTQGYAPFRFAQSQYLGTATIRNNVMLNAGGSSYVNYGGADYSFSSLNSWDSLKSGNVQGDPLFANVQTSFYTTPENFDFTLRSGSPASGISIAADAPSMDVKRSSRGSKPDGGAYQCNGGGGTQTVPLQISTASLAAGTVGTSYAQSLSATGGTSPYTWSVASGSLPGGLAISGSTITGTPSASGTFSFTVKVTDNASNTATASLSITVAAAPVAASLSNLSCGASSLTSNGSTTCTVTLSAAASSAIAVSLSDNSSVLTVPASVTVASGATTASFTAAAGTVSSAATVTVTASYNGVSKTASIALTVPAPVAALSGLSCGASSLASNASTTCTVTLSAAASSAIAVSLSDNSSVLTVPASVTVASGATTASFTAAAGTVSSAATVTVTASYNGVSKTASIALTAPAPVAALSALSCGASSLTSGASTTCTASLTAAAPTGGATVTVSSNSSMLTVPASVTVAAGATSASFNAAAGTCNSTSAATVTAAAAGVSKTASITVQPATSTTPPPATPVTGAKFLLQGTASEVTGTTNGATVKPVTGPTGKLTVRGSGSVNFTSAGVAFKKGGQQNSNTAFYNFAGTQVGNVFNSSQGEISFDVTSSYSFASRLALPQYNYRQVFDVYDNSKELFYFHVEAIWGRLILYYNMGGPTGQYFYVPVGYEDQAFGAGQKLSVRMVWDGKTMTLFLDGYQVAQTAYTPVTPSWTSGSSFTLGATDTHVFTGGYYSCDDAISNFQVK